MGRAFAALFAFALACGSGCHPSEGGVAQEAQSIPDSSTVPLSPFDRLKDAATQALTRGSCLEGFVAIPANATAIPVRFDKETGEATQLPYLAGESSYYLPVDSLNEGSATDTTTVRICFDNLRKIAKVSSRGSELPAEVRSVQVCGVRTGKPPQTAAGSAVTMSEHRSCDTLLPARP